MTVSKITNAPTQKELIDKTNEIIDNLGGGGGSSTDVQINGTSITSQGVANIITNSAYNASSNKIATMSDLPTVVTYTGGTGISIGTGNAINHTNSVTAGTAGTSSATSGSTLAVPYVTYDAQGHVTASGTHTHTVTGFLTSITSSDVTSALGYTPYNSTNPSGYITGSSYYVASSRFDGQWVWKRSEHSWTNAGSYDISLASYLPADHTTYGYLVYCTIGAGRGSSNGGYSIGTVASPYDNADNNFVANCYLNSSFQGWYSNNIFPVAANGKLYSQLKVKLNSAYCYLIGYRRIGTNS